MRNRKDKEIRKTKSQITIDQHYVWKHYLKAWARTNHFLFRHVRGNKEASKTSPKSAGVEPFSYATQELTKGDLAVLEALISKFPREEIRETARGWVQMFQLGYSLRPMVDRIPQNLRREAMEHLEFAEKMLGEEFHGYVETQAVPLLNSVRAKNLSFMANEQKRIAFLFFLCNQYFRTRKMRQASAYGANRPVADHDPKRTALIESVIFATNVAGGLFCQWDRYKILMLENKTDSPFLTGDQPVLSLLGAEGGPQGDALELYYPLNPELVLVVTQDHEKFPGHSRQVRKMEAETYNYMIYEQAAAEVYSHDRTYLNRFVETVRSAPC